MDYILSTIILITSLIALFYAYFRKNETAKLSIFILFGSFLLQETVKFMMDISLFDAIDSLLSRLNPFIIYGEIILLLIVFLTRMGKTNRILKAALLLLVLAKIFEVLNLF